MHTYERSSIINLLIIAKILIFGVIVVNIRRAEEKDIPQIEELLYQVHKVHSDKRPDLFIPGSKKYTTNELKEILADDEKPVYVADNDGVILGYAFCVYQRHCTKSSNYTSLYIDDLCVSENSRGLKIGIIGCGAIGKDHCRRIIETVPGATVVAVSDYVAAAADETAAKYGIKSYGNDCDGMIKDPEVEAVVITSIDPTHHDYVMKTLAEEKWCFCEKPLSQNAKDCEEIIRREQEIGKRLVQVGFMRHYDRGYAEMKRIIASGELGKPLIIKACHRNVSQGPGFKTENGVTNVAIHELDICRWLLDDEYEDVQCVKVRQSSNSDKGYDNPQVMLMRTKKGCFIDVEVQVADGYGYDIQCEVVCENGTVKLPDPYAVVCRSRPAGWDSVKPAESMPIMTDWKERFIEAYDIEFCKWVESVHAGKLTGPSSWDGYVACVAGDALNASRGTSQFLKVETMEKPEMYK